MMDASAFDHRALIVSLTPETRSEITKRTNAPGLMRLSIHLGLILGLGTFIAIQIPFWGLLLLPQGLLLTCLFMLEHECTHKTPFRLDWLNEFVGRAAGLLIFLPFTWFRYFHLAHHRHTNDPENDPELSSDGKPETWTDYLIYLSGYRYWKSVFGTLFRLTTGRETADYLPQKRLPDMEREAVAMVLLYTGLLIALPFAPWLLWAWLLPLVIGQPFLRLYLLAEHGRCPQVANMFDNTRTTVTNRLVRFFAWNMPYHAEHHAYPDVPFHQLPAFHTFTHAHLRQVSDGYVAFNRNFAQKLTR